ncbi:hypothetical protein BC628DRAFT_32259 [Trametes gibbosa]|nr:hypothetical protein BC628DRAFT_32259 [Trametes gibbosa]
MFALDARDQSLHARDCGSPLPLPPPPPPPPTKRLSPPCALLMVRIVMCVAPPAGQKDFEVMIACQSLLCANVFSKHPLAEAIPSLTGRFDRPGPQLDKKQDPGTTPADKTGRGSAVTSLEGPVSVFAPPIVDRGSRNPEVPGWRGGLSRY